MIPLKNPCFGGGVDVSLLRASFYVLFALRLRDGRTVLIGAGR